MAAETTGEASCPAPNEPIIFHTVTACRRCRVRKTRCDPGLPQCDACLRSGKRCEYFDASTGQLVTRSYVTWLQDDVRQAYKQLTALENGQGDKLDPEEMARGPTWIRFNEQVENRFLGPSSGIAITRFVMELARQNTQNKAIHEVISDDAALEIKNSFTEESQNPTSKRYGLTSLVAAPELPPTSVIYNLVMLYMAKAQYMLPLLHEPTFRTEVQAVLNGDPNPTYQFQLHLVMAIGLQKHRENYAGLADSYYLAALPFLEAVLRKRDLSTLQCLALMAQYSVLTPSRTAAYWVVGMAVQLSKELGLNDEKNMREWPPGQPLDFLQEDMRRRISWIILSMEYGLAHSLGRPSAYAFKGAHSVKFFQLCDDSFITRDGLLPGHYPIMKKCIAVHFFKMRLLQWEIRRNLYVRRLPSPKTDQDPWFESMQRKLDEWVARSPKNDEGSGLSEAWFQGRKNTMIVFMYRPSPQIPVPSDQAAEWCYQACVANVGMQSRQIEGHIVDLTWIFTQALFMALNTILWSLSYPSIRKNHPVEEVYNHLSLALKAINYTSDRWPGVESAVQLYKNLIHNCLKAYSTEDSFVIGSAPVPSLGFRSSPGPGSVSSAGSVSLPLSPPPHQGYREDSGGPEGSINHLSPSHTDSSAYTGDNTTYPDSSNVSPDHRIGLEFHSPAMSHQAMQEGQLNPVSFSTVSYGLPDATIPDTQAMFPATTAATSAMAFPSLPVWDPNASQSNLNAAFYGHGNFDLGAAPWLGSFGDEYSNYMGQSISTSTQKRGSLSEEEHQELMAQLVQENIPEVSHLQMGNVATTYQTM